MRRPVGLAPGVAGARRIGLSTGSAASGRRRAHPTGGPAPGLAAGGSLSPQELGAIVGVDLSDPGFWEAGLDLVERQLQQAEEAARASGRL